MVNEIYYYYYCSIRKCDENSREVPPMIGPSRIDLYMPVNKKYCREGRT
jgi:hypothetical protein